VPSIKDVAHYSGVSYATVSNVINNKGNVGEETRRRVLEAIKVLRYIPHAGARTLKGSAQRIVGIILPAIHDPFLARFYMGVQDTLLINNDFMLNLIISDNIASVENNALSALLQQRIAGLVLMSCQPENRRAFHLLEEKKIPLVLVERDIELENANFVSFNYENIGTDLCTHLFDKGITRVALLTGPEEYTSNKMLIEGFSKTFRDRGFSTDDLTVVTSVYNRFGAFKSMFRLLNLEYSEKLPEIVVTSSMIIHEGAREAVQIQRDLETKRLEVINLDDENWFNTSDRRSAGPVYRPAKILGKTASELLLENIRTRMIHTPKTKMLEHIRLSTMEKEPLDTRNDSRVFQGKATTLNMYMLEDNSTQAISALIPDFRKKYSHNIHVDIEQYHYDDLHGKIMDTIAADGDTAPDILMFDNPWLPQLVKNGVLIELSSFLDDDPEAKVGFIPGVFESYSTYRGGSYALPFHFEAQLLFYRKDLFNNESIKRSFSQKYGLELKVPLTWDEYNAIAEFFTREYNDESPIVYGNTATAATTTLCDFLPRLWSYGGSVLDRSGNLALGSHEAIEALESYIRSFRFAPKDAVDHWYWDEVREFARGSAAMMIMFIAHTSQLIDFEYSNITGKFDVSGLPGGFPVLGGWSLGIHSRSRNKEAAYHFISWACSTHIAIPYTILGGCTPRSSLHQTEELLNLYPYFIFAEEQFKKSRKRTFPHEELPGFEISEREFEIIVHRHLRDAIKGSCSPKDALVGAENEINEFKLVQLS
jgi:multiple sugar transport system substrate-binding protein